MTSIYLTHLSLKFFLWIINIPSIDIKSLFVGKCKEGLQKKTFLVIDGNQNTSESKCM